MFLSILDAEKDQLCRELYPELCLQNSKVERIVELPDEISTKIHFMRRVEDVTLSRQKVAKMFGFGQNTAKDRILDFAFGLPTVSMFLQPLLYQHPFWEVIQSLLVDKQVVLVLCFKVPTTYMILSDELQTDPQIAKVVLKRDPLFYVFLPSSLKRRWDFVSLGVAGNPEVCTSMPIDMLANEEIGLKLVQLNAYTFCFLSPALKRNRRIILTAFSELWSQVEVEFGKSILDLDSREIEVIAHLMIFSQSDS